MRTPGGTPSPVRGSQTTFFKSMIVCPCPKDRGRLLEAIMSAALPGVQGVSSRTRVIPTVARQCIHVGVSRGGVNPWYCTVSPFLAMIAVGFFLVRRRHLPRRVALKSKSPRRATVTIVDHDDL